MNRHCSNCKKVIRSHVWIVSDRDYCSPKCQRLLNEEALLDKHFPVLWRLRRRGRNRDRV